MYSRWGSVVVRGAHQREVEGCEQWLHLVRNMQPRPPMPWFNLRSMSEADLKAIYAYTRALGAAGEPAPAYVPPGGAPTGPVVRFPQ